MKRLAFVLVAFMGACTVQNTPPPMSPAPGPAPVAADNGQPRLQAALASLQSAQTELESATADKGGHRVAALAFVKKAIDDVNAGMQYAATHANEVGDAEGPAEEEPVDENVNGAAMQPHMGQAMVDLREARKQLKDAKHDKGGFRNQAMMDVRDAMKEVREGIRFDNHH
jgi:hypothetical protein